MNKLFKEKGIKGLIFSIISSVLGFILLILDAFIWINNVLMDDIYQEPKKTSDIFIVGIDDKSIEALGPYNTWTREHYAKVLDNLSNGASGAPAVIAFDILFTGESDEENDAKLRNSAQNSLSTIVCASNLIFGDVMDNASFTLKSTVKGESKPYNNLNEVVKTGYANTLLDTSDGLVRKVIPVMEYDGNIYESFSYMIYKEYNKKLGNDYNIYNNNDIYRINFSAKPQESYTVISFSDVYNGLVPSDIEDAIVLVGAYAAGMQDSYYTPINRGKLNYGVEVHANIIDSYLKNNLISDVPNYVISIIGLVLLFVLAFLIYKSKFLFATIVSLSSILLLIIIQIILYKNYYYFPIFGLIILIIIVYIAYIAIKYGEELINRYKTVNLFKKYVAPQVVDKALKSNDYKVNVGGERRHIACLFVDIRGFTPLSESLEPEQVVAILDEYLSLTTKAVFEVGGTLDKFIGDATMAIFNAPFDLDDYPYLAVKAAWLIAKGSEDIDKIAYSKFGRHVSFGIGVNLGYAVVGNIGSSARIDYTAIGDTVNTAARLEANAKAGEILISEVLYEEIKTRIEAEFYGDLVLKGKSQPVRTYKVTGLKEE